MVARGDHPIESAPAGDPMIGMRLVVAPRIVGEHDLGLVRPDDKANLRAQLHRAFELAVLPA